MNFIFDRFPIGTVVSGPKETAETLRMFKGFKTWGYMGEALNDSSLNCYYLVPHKPVAPVPPKRNPEETEVTFEYRAGVITDGASSYFCCEYAYSYDEFRQTKHYGNFRIKMSEENKLVLEWIVRKRQLLIMSRSPEGSHAFDLESFLGYLSRVPNFILQLNNVAMLAFHNDYLDLFDPDKQKR